MSLTPAQRELYEPLSDLEKRMATAVLAGMRLTDALHYAAPDSVAKNSTAKAVATAIRDRPHVRAFINSVTDGFLNEAIMKREEALERLAAIARSSLGDIVKPVEVDGNITWELRREALHDKDALQNVAQLTPTSQGPRIVMYSVPQAIAQMAAMCGWNTKTTYTTTTEDGTVKTQQVDASKLSSATLKELIELGDAHPRLDG